MLGNFPQAFSIGLVNAPGDLSGPAARRTDLALAGAGLV